MMFRNSIRIAQHSEELPEREFVHPIGNLVENYRIDSGGGAFCCDDGRAFGQQPRGTMQDPVVVLVVEDEVLLRMDIVEELEARGFAVLEAGTAAQAIRLLTAHPEIAVLFTDVEMPGSMDGLMLAAAVRERWPPVKIIITSGHRRAGVGDMPKGSRFLQKPYTGKAVETAVLQMVA